MSATSPNSSSLPAQSPMPSSRATYASSPNTPAGVPNYQHRYNDEAVSDNVYQPRMQTGDHPVDADMQQHTPSSLPQGDRSESSDSGREPVKPPETPSHSDTPQTEVAPMKPKKYRMNWRAIGLTTRVMQLLAECAAEFLGTFLLILIGDSVSAMGLLITPSPYLQAYWGICICWGLAVTFAIFATGAVSGAHLNPAVTVAFAVFRGFPWTKALPYIISQVMGAMCGSLAMYSQYYPLFDAYYASTGTTRSTDVQASKVWFTAPNDAMHNWNGYCNEIYQTGILLFGIFAITDPYNPNAFPNSGMKALFIGLLVATIGAAFGFLEGFALNPARDFGPRMAAFALGWGEMAFPGYKNYWWAPVFGPFTGALLGAALYEAFIRPFMPGVRAHGETVFTRYYATVMIKMFPRLREEYEDSDDEEDDEDAMQEMEKGKKKAPTGDTQKPRARKHSEWQLDAGPGMPQMPQTGMTPITHPRRAYANTSAPRRKHIDDGYTLE